MQPKQEGLEEKTGCVRAILRQTCRRRNSSIWCIGRRVAMQFAEAFERLGYSVEAQRHDWSAENERGVCISLWQKEMGVRDGLLWRNTRVHADPLEGWKDKPGNRKRSRHLKRALDEFGGQVDVVIVSGEPGVSYGTAQPWLAEEHGPARIGRSATWTKPPATSRRSWF
jgi:hypothetical protein